MINMLKQAGIELNLIIQKLEFKYPEMDFKL